MATSSSSSVSLSSSSSLEIAHSGTAQAGAPTPNGASSTAANNRVSLDVKGSASVKVIGKQQPPLPKTPAQSRASVSSSSSSSSGANHATLSTHAAAARHLRHLEVSTKYRTLPLPRTPQASSSSSSSAAAATASAGTAVRRSIGTSELTSYRALSIEDLYTQITTLSQKTVTHSNDLAELVEITRDLRLVTTKLEKAVKATIESTGARARAESQVDAREKLRQLTAAKMILKEKIIAELRVAVDRYMKALSEATDVSKKTAVNNQFFAIFAKIVAQAEKLIHVKAEVETELLHLLGPHRYLYLRYALQMPEKFTAFKNKSSAMAASSNSKEKSAKGPEELDGLAREALDAFVSLNDKVEFVIYALELDVEEQRRQELPTNIKLERFNGYPITTKSIVLYNVLIQKIIAILDPTQKFENNLNKFFINIHARVDDLSYLDIQDGLAFLIHELQRLFIRLKGTVASRLHSSLFTTLYSLFPPANEVWSAIHQTTNKDFVIMILINQILIYRLSKQFRIAPASAKQNITTLINAFEYLIDGLKRRRGLNTNQTSIGLGELLVVAFFKRPPYQWALEDLESTLFGKSYAWQVFNHNPPIAQVDFVRWEKQVSSMDRDTLMAMIADCPEDKSVQFRTFVLRCNIIVQIIQDCKNCLPANIPGYFIRLETMRKSRGEDETDVSRAFIEGIEAVEKAIGVERTYALQEQRVVSCFMTFTYDSIDTLIQNLHLLTTLSLREMITILEKNQEAIAKALKKLHVKELITQLTAKMEAAEKSADSSTEVATTAASAAASAAMTAAQSSPSSGTTATSSTSSSSSSSSSSMHPPFPPAQVDAPPDATAANSSSSSDAVSIGSTASPSIG